jgi:hypothetical protein
MYMIVMIMNNLGLLKPIGFFVVALTVIAIFGFILRKL